jgi:hypothetical protein
MRPGRNGFEAPADVVERKQNAPGDPEIGSVKSELALLFALRDPGKGAQIGDQGETLDVIVGRRTSRRDSRRRGID